LYTGSIALFSDIYIYVLHEKIGRQDPTDKISADIKIVEVVLEE